MLKRVINLNSQSFSRVFLGSNRVVKSFVPYGNRYNRNLHHLDCNRKDILCCTPKSVQLLKVENNH